MALKPTIYKVDLSLSDMDRHRYPQLRLTLALHPSETEERLLVRLLAFADCYAEGIEFTRGISQTDEPDVWQHSLSGEIEQWIEVGQPDAERVISSARKAKRVAVYAYGSSCRVWQQKQAAKLAGVRNLDLCVLPYDALQALLPGLSRNCSCSLMISDGEWMVTLGEVSLSLAPQWLQRSEG
ncbi:YaeQ family protein [Aestuariirhabdus litorea]|uniref:YaeQ family protein n=1 Tax=Aestuariirhabdus litorea TaxID=2528527 RepID=A0A3P3VR74_9GAMM|nr:YaeQ family protein [Aestuariirhabdus litorea]RRJ85225.1 YaeQ family protein [Aestuariirhabdus litorea]RWW98446.1 YaeQ family protein [Endozoicomonadaceae bacterium GTF-13]